MRLAIIVVCALSASCLLDWSLREVPSEAGVDGGSDGPPTVFSCAGASFCTTFDEANALALWTDSFTAAGGELSLLNDGTAPSSPKVLFARRPSQSDGANHAYVTKIFKEPTTSASLELMIQPEKVEGNARACVAGIVFRDGLSDERILRLVVAPGDTFLQTKSPVASVPLGQALPAGVWTRVKLAVSVGGDLTVAFNGNQVFTRPVDPGWPSSTNTRIFAGLNFVEVPNNTPVIVRVDNVRADLR